MTRKDYELITKIIARVKTDLTRIDLLSLEMDLYALMKKDSGTNLNLKTY